MIAAYHVEEILVLCMLFDEVALAVRFIYVYDIWYRHVTSQEGQKSLLVP